MSVLPSRFIASLKDAIEFGRIYVGAVAARTIGGPPRGDGPYTDRPIWQ
jgi:hypothetical protein